MAKSFSDWKKSGGSAQQPTVNPAGLGQPSVGPRSFAQWKGQESPTTAPMISWEDQYQQYVKQYDMQQRSMDALANAYKSSYEGAVRTNKEASHMTFEPGMEGYATDELSAYFLNTNPNYGKRVSDEELAEKYKKWQEAEARASENRSVGDYWKSMYKFHNDADAVVADYDKRIAAMEANPNLKTDPSVYGSGNKDIEALKAERDAFVLTNTQYKNAAEDYAVLMAWNAGNKGTVASYEAAKSAYDQAEADLQALYTDRKSKSGPEIAALGAGGSTPNSERFANDEEIQAAIRKRDQAKMIMDYAYANRFEDIKNLEDYDLTADKGEIAWQDFKENEQTQEMQYDEYGNPLGINEFDPYYHTNFADQNENWTEDEKKTFYYLFATNRDNAFAYGNEVNAKYAKAEAEENSWGTREWAQRDFGTGAVASLLSIPAGLVGGLYDYMNMAAENQGAGGIYTTQYGGWSNWSEDVRGSIGNVLNSYGTIPDSVPVLGDKGLGDAYQLVMSMADSAVAVTAGGGIANLMFFGNAAANATRNALERGASPDKALTLGLASGAAEVLGEWISVDKLLSNDLEDYLRTGILKSMLIQGGVEGSEEFFTTLLNTAADAVINGNKSELKQKIEQYTAAGMNYAEAEKKAKSEWLEDICFDAMGGFLSGLGMSGAHIGLNVAANSMTPYQGDVQTLMDLTELTDEGSKSRRFQPKLQGALDAENAAYESYKAALEQQGVNTGGESEQAPATRQSIEERRAGIEEEGAAQIQQEQAAEAAQDEAARGQERTPAQKATPAEQNAAQQEEGKAQTQERTPKPRATISQFKGMQIEAALREDLSAKDRTVLEEKATARLTDLGVENAGKAASAVVDRVLGSEKGAIGRVVSGLNFNDSRVRIVLQELTEQLAGQKTSASWLGNTELMTVGRNNAWTRTIENGLKQVRVKGSSERSKVTGATMVDGKLNLTVEQDGKPRTLSQDQLDLSDSQQRALGLLTRVLGNDAANAYEGMTIGNMGDVLQVMRYASAFGTVRDVLGRAGVKDDAALASPLRKGLTDAQVLRALAAGRKLGPVPEGQRVKSRRGTGAVSLEGGTLDGRKLGGVKNREAVTNSQRYKTIKRLAEELGIDVVLYESDEADDKGNLEDAPHGAYKDGVIWLDWNAGVYNVNKFNNKNGVRDYSSEAEALIFLTMSHELTHFLEQNAEKEYNELRDFITQYMADNGKDFNGMVRRKLAEQSNIDHDEAVREVIADACQTMLVDSKYVEQLINEKPTLWERIRDWIRNFFGFAKTQAKGPEFEAIRDVAAQISEIWDRALQVAVENREASDPADAVTDVANDNGQTVAVRNDATGSMQLSIRTYEEGGHQALDDFLDNQVRKKALTDREATEIRLQMQEMYRICKEFDNGKYAPFSAWSNASVVTYDGRPVFSVVKANGEYKLNLDFSLVCKKRRTLDAVFNEMIRKGIMGNFDMVQESIAKINDIIRENGFETACGLCFVDSKRYRQAMIADAFVRMYNQQVISLARKDQGQKINFFNYGGDGTIKTLASGIESLADEDLNWTEVDKILRTEKKSTVKWKIANYLKNNPGARRLVMRGDFMSTAGFDALKAKNPELLSLYNSKKGAGGPKAAQSDVQYLNEIIQQNAFNEKAAYEVGGVRIQSFSDYVGRLVFDYVQMVGDLAAKKLPAHSYTKEYLFALQFGLTGIKINMSLVPEVIKGGVAAGLDANGDYAWKDGQSFGSTVYDNRGARMTAAEGFELAKRIQNADGYSRNCGTIAVGVSDEHILKMLGDPDIRMIIPYHKSSLNHIVASMMNIDKCTDYTLSQNTRVKKNGKWTKLTGGDFNFNEALQRLGDAKAAANEYLAWCEKNGYKPKFDQFEDHENYYKLLEDFSCYDRDGTTNTPMGAVQMKFPTASDAFGSMSDLIEQGLDEDAMLQAKQEKAVPEIVRQIESVLPDFEADVRSRKKGSTGDIRYSARAGDKSDRDYLAAVERGDMETAQWMVTEAARAAGYTSPKLYHGTNAFGFTKIDVKKSNDKRSFFVTESIETASTYSGTNVPREIGAPGSKASSLGMYQFYADTSGMLELDAKGAQSDHIALGAAESEYNYSSGKKSWYSYATAKQIAEFAKREGYTGVIIRNVIDTATPESRGNTKPSDVYAFFKPQSQLKSADPVTYDDAGNVIPLSERFNTSTGDIRYSARTNLGYHAGDLGKAEHLNIQGRDRGTGHFGTGTYFVGVEEKVTKDSYYGKRPQHAVDFTDYNLFKVHNDRDGYRLHDFLRIVDGGIKREWIQPALNNEFSIINPTGYYDLARDKYGEDWALGDNLLNAILEYAADNGISVKTLDEYKADEGKGLDDSDAKDYYEEYVKDTVKEEIGRVNAEYRKFMDAVFDVHLFPGFTRSKLFSALTKVADYQDATPRNARVDSYATVFMKAMGYEGVDVRGTRLDNTEYGSAIYDVKPETVQYSARTGDRTDRELLLDASDASLTDAEQKARAAYRAQVDGYRSRQQAVVTLIDAMDKAVRDGDATAATKLRAKLTEAEKKMAQALAGLTEAERGPELREILRREREIQRRRTDSRIRESYGRRELRQKVDRLWKDLTKRLSSPSEKKNIPVNVMMQAVDVLEAINMDATRADSKAGQKLRDRLNELKSRYNALKNDTDFRQAAMYDPQVAEFLDNMIETVGDTPINRMSAQQLAAVYNTLKALDHVARGALKLRLRTMEYSAYDISKRMTEETRSVGKQKAGAIDMFLNASLSPARMFNRLGGYHKDSTWSQVYEMLNEGQLRQTQLQVEGSMLFEDLLAAKDYGKFVDPKNTVDVGLKDADGKTIEITHGMLVSLYMHLMNEQNRRHVAYGGLTIPGLTDYYNGKKIKGTENAKSAAGVLQEIAEINDRLYDLKSRPEDQQDPGVIEALEAKRDSAAEKAMSYLEELQAAVEGKLTDYDWKWISACRELFDGFSKRALNEATMQVYGIKRANVENYFPIWVDGNFLNTPFESVAKDFSLENAGFMKERVDSAKPIRLADVSDVAASQIRKVAQYAGLMPVIHDFNKIWGKTQTGYRDSVRQAVMQTYGQSGVNYIENLMADLNGARGMENSPLGEMLNRLRGHMAQASLTLSLRTAMGQAASYPTAASVLGWEPLAKALAHGGKGNTIISRADQELILKWSPLLKYRLQGYRDPELGQIAQMNSKFDRVWKKARWATGWIQAVDGATVGRLWYACEYYVQDHNKDLKKGTDAYYEAVARKFNEVVELTQPNYTTMQRPDILRNPNALVRQLTMFLTQRLQNFNIMYDAAATYSQMRKDRAAGKYGVTNEDVRQAGIRTRTAALSQITAAATIVAFKFLADMILHSMNAYRDDDDELTKESISAELLDMFLDSLAGNVLGGGELYDLIESKAFGKTYYGIEVSGVSTVTDALKAVNDFYDKVAKGEVSWKEADKLAKKISVIAGIPYANAEKIIRGGIWHVQDMINGEFGSFEAGVDRTTGQQAHRLWRAYDAKDFTQAKKIRDEVGDDDKLNQALAAYIKKQYADGKINKFEAQRQLEKYAGKDKETAEKTMREYSSEVETGIKFSQIEDSFLLGDITAQKAQQMLVKYGGLDAQTAKMKVDFWGYQNKNPGTKLEFSSYKTYVSKYQGIGLTVAQYESYSERLKDCKGVDADGDGKTDSGSKKAEVVKLIDSMSLTPAQKDQLYFANNYGASGLKDTPWHK